MKANLFPTQYHKNVYMVAVDDHLVILYSNNTQVSINIDDIINNIHITTINKPFNN